MVRKKTGTPKRLTVGCGQKFGLAPGTPVFVGERKLDKGRIDIMDYAENRLEEKRGASVEECLRLKDVAGVTWINVNGIHDVALVAALAERFGLHPLTLEDIVDTAHRPKTEEFDAYIFIVLKMMSYNDATGDIDIEHVSLIIGDGYVVSFLEDEGDVFDAVRERIRSAKGRIRKLKADYLAYALMDTVVDNYFVVLERIGEHIETLDDEIVAGPMPQHMHAIHRLKRGILGLRRSVWPLREEIGALEKSDSQLIEDGTRIYLRDLYDHTVQVIDMVETQRDILGGMHDTYLSSVSNRMNEIMKVLTIIATIFIPLTFIVGVYGMNFEHMPELKWPWGYSLVWGVMVAVGLGMVCYFRKKKWF